MTCDKPVSSNGKHFQHRCRRGSLPPIGLDVAAVVASVAGRMLHLVKNGILESRNFTGLLGPVVALLRAFA
jgi:hypothetical protein